MVGSEHMISLYIAIKNGHRSKSPVSWGSAIFEYPNSNTMYLNITIVSPHSIHLKLTKGNFSWLTNVRWIVLFNLICHGNWKKIRIMKKSQKGLSVLCVIHFSEIQIVLDIVTAWSCHWITHVKPPHLHYGAATSAWRTKEQTPDDQARRFYLGSPVAIYPQKAHKWRRTQQLQVSPATSRWYLQMSRYGEYKSLIAVISPSGGPRLLKASWDL